MTLGADLDVAGLRLDIEDAEGGAIATVTLNRPERHNAMTGATWLGLARIGAELPDKVRVVVVRGEGPSFSSGIDLRMFSAEGVPGEPRPEGLAADEASTREWIARAQAGYLWLRRPEIVSIAAVHGYAIGAGFQLALACDMRVIADDAKFCMKEPSLGLVPDLTGSKPLVDILGLPRAIELCLTGRAVGAPEATALGLAELMVSRSALDGAVRDLAAALLAIDPGAARATKALLCAAPGNTLEEQAAAEREAQLGRLRALFGGQVPAAGSAASSGAGATP